MTIMIPSQWKELVPIVAAFTNGEEVEELFHHGPGDDVWMTVSVCAFSKGPSNYRIKPKPREIWVFKHAMFWSKINAIECLEKQSIGYSAKDIIHFKEVI